MKNGLIWMALALVAAFAAWRAFRSRDQKAIPSAPVVSGSPPTASVPASEGGQDRFEPLYERSVHGRLVRVGRSHVAAAPVPMHGALARTRSGQWVSAVLLTPIDELDPINDLEPPELLSGTAFAGSCGVSLFMYVDAGKDARSCADSLDQARELGGRRETLDLAKLGGDPTLFANVVDFEGHGVPMRLVSVFGVIDDLCFAMHATMKADSDRRFGLVASVVKGLSLAAKRWDDL